MEEGEGVSVKTLRAKFQNDPMLRIQTKPAIPEKPKTLPSPTSPTSKVTNPLISSINSAMENRMAPRVVFKDDRKSPVKRQFSQPEVFPPKVKEPLAVQPELLDKNQKKEGDLVKQALKDKNLPLVLPVSPVTPVIGKTPEPEPTPSPPVLASPAKVTTPKNKTVFNFKRSVKDNKQKTDSSKSAPPDRTVLASPAPTGPTPASASLNVKEPIATGAKIPQVLADTITVSSIPAPSVSAPVQSPPIVPQSEVSAPTVSQPDIVLQTTPNPETLKPENHVTPKASVKAPEPEVYSPSLPAEVTPLPEMPDILDIDIPPPIIPDDFDEDISIPEIPPTVFLDSPVPGVAEVAASATAVSSSPVLYRTPSPSPASSRQVTPEPSTTKLPATISPESHTSSGPSSSSPSPEKKLPAAGAEPLVENQAAKSDNMAEPKEQTLEIPPNSSTPPKTISPLSALARAEQMVPNRQNHCDQRLLNLLERAKRSYSSRNQPPTPTTPDITTPQETDLPVIDLPDKQEALPPEKEQPATAIAPENPAVEHVDIPPVDYEEQAAKMKFLEPAQNNDIDHRQTSPVPKVRVVQSSARVKSSPPPPPPRRTLASMSSVDLTPEKPPRQQSTDDHTTLQPAQPAIDKDIIIPVPEDFALKDSTTEDLKMDHPQANAPEDRLSALVHEQSFLDQLSTEQETSVNINDADISTTDAGFADMCDSSQTVSHTIPSPAGSLERNNSVDVSGDPKGKTLMKQRKGSPMNPYAETSTTEDSSRKSLFSKKNVGPDEKELKKKEKQKEKEKEKEKERERKEQKEKEREKKEREKKEQKDKEKEKELKEKEKEKKEQKEKEKEKKDQKEKEKEKKDKDKEKEKKELKEKEREKKEQKEREKRESEIKKKFKLTGEEEILFQAKVIEDRKGRKNDLAVRTGETISVIRTTGCPQGKWLARDSDNKYGYVSVESVELNMQEMVELGKKAKANKTNGNGLPEDEITSTGSRSSNHFALHHESFTDDSEEWCDDEDTPFTPTDTTDLGFSPGLATPETVSPQTDQAQQDQTHTNDNVQARQEALRKLATFFTQPGPVPLKNSTIIEEPEPEEPLNSAKQEADLQILPPPDLYADIIVGEAAGIYSN